jgi:ComF family protein
VLPQIAILKGAALNLVFPKRCVGCGREGSFICSKCLHTIKHFFPPLCPLCGRPQINGILCQDCVNWNAKVDGIRSPFHFDGVIREAIHQLKYKQLSSISGQLAYLIYEYLISYPLPVDVLVPVPLHPKRLRERGYNQSALLVRELGQLSGLPVVNECLIRKRYTPPQARTNSVNERWENVVGTFTCRSNEVANRKVLLIDDVATSGATLNACANALKNSGAISVWGLVLAREI